MKKLTLLLLILLVTVFCAKKTETYRQEITQTFADGKKEILCKYSRVNGKETVVEQITYNYSGQIVMIEYPTTKITKKLFWHHNGRISDETIYWAGKKHGRWLGWYSNGTLKAESFFHLGQLVRQVVHKPPFTIDNRYQKRQLIHTKKYKDGSLARETFFLAGKVTKQLFFYPDGQMSDLREYKEGVLHGRCAYWDRNGEKRSEAFYQNGTPMAKNE